tara:strand:+ start:1184 stop:2554 length:1371 start_codon:yes stop_codon:yes gene_type:complete
MSSFREIFSNIHSNNANNFSLEQARKLRKQREGFEGIPKDLEEGDSMYNMWGTDATQTSDIGSKLKKLNDYERLTYGPDGEDMNKYKTWAYKAATFSIHKDKMDKALIDCRKRCNENIGSGDVAEKQVKGCQIGCTVAYPRYSNPTSTFIPVNNDGEEWKDTDTLEAKMSKGNQICKSLASGTSPVCNNGIIIAENSDKLDQAGILSSVSPRTSCVECGGINSIVGKWSYRMDDLVKDGRAIPNGGLITDTMMVDSTGKLTKGGNGLGCDNINDSVIKNACKCSAGEAGASNCGDISNIKFTVDEDGNTIKTSYESNEFADALSKFGSRIGEGSSSWRTEDTGSKSLSQRYKELTSAARDYQRTNLRTSKQFKNINDFIKQTPNKVKNLEDSLNSNIMKLTNYMSDVEKQKMKKDTLDGRIEDSSLQKESQLYKNWAGGILAISLLTVAIYKLKQI